MSCCTKTSGCCNIFSNGCKAKLTGTKTILGLPALPGSPITYLITINNISTCNALNVVLIDVLPENVFVPGSLIISPQGTVDGNVVTVNIGTIPAKSPFAVTITGTLNVLLPPLFPAFTNTAFVAGSNVCNTLTLQTSFTI